jgi:RNA polymerase sigma factor (TIGR02999 family)
VATERLTQMLNRLDGAGAAEDAELMRELYGELHVLAEQHMNRQGGAHTLQPTALVSEAWVRIAGAGELHFDKRAQFFALAGKVMRSVLVDHARQKAAAKRGGSGRRITLAGEPGVDGGPDLDLLALEDALARLEQLDPELARLVELRFFGGLDHPAVARVLGVPLRRVERSWRLAKAWLHGELTK